MLAMRHDAFLGLSSMPPKYQILRYDAETELWSIVGTAIDDTELQQAVERLKSKGCDDVVVYQLARTST